MKRLLFFLLFLAVMMSVYAQSEIKAYGDSPKARGVIQGVVRDSVGPMDAFICEKDYKNKEVEFTFADRNGHFSFKLVNNAGKSIHKSAKIFTIVSFQIPTIFSKFQKASFQFHEKTFLINDIISVKVFVIPLIISVIYLNEKTTISTTIPKDSLTPSLKNSHKGKSIGSRRE